jgi:hypothetical protein
VLLADRGSTVSPFAQFHDGSGIFTFEEQSAVLTPISVSANCLQAFASFSPYSPGEEKFLPLAQPNADMEALGKIEFSLDVPAMYVAIHKTGNFEMGVHSDSRVDDSSRPDYHKAAGELFSNGRFVVAKGESHNSAETKGFYFTAAIDGKGDVRIFGAEQVNEANIP